MDRRSLIGWAALAASGLVPAFAGMRAVAATQTSDEIIPLWPVGAAGRRRRAG